MQIGDWVYVYAITDLSYGPKISGRMRVLSFEKNTVEVEEDGYFIWSWQRNRVFATRESAEKAGKKEYIKKLKQLLKKAQCK